MTLDPEDRYRKVEKPAPTKLPRHYSSTEALQPHAIQNQHEISSSDSSGSDSSEPRLAASGESGSDYSTGCDDSWTSSLMKEDEAPPPSSLRRWRSKLPKLRRFGPTPSENAPERPSTRSGAPSQSKGSFESLGALPVLPTLHTPQQPVGAIERSPDLNMDPQKTLPLGAGLGINLGHKDVYEDTRLESTICVSGAQNLRFPPRISSRAPPPSLSESYQDRCEDEASPVATANVLSLSPSSETSGIDVNSPTFTAATISSSGFDSPKRLSHDYTFEDCLTRYEPSIAVDDDPRTSVDDVAEQFAGLRTENEHDFATPRSNLFADHYFLTPSNLLGSEAASSSQVTLKKSPSDFGKESTNDDTSLRDAIFDEFRYLTHAIN